MKLEQIAKEYGMHDYYEQKTGRVFKLSEADELSDDVLVVPVYENGVKIGIATMDNVLKQSAEKANKTEPIDHIDLDKMSVKELKEMGDKVADKLSDVCKNTRSEIRKIAIELNVPYEVLIQTYIHSMIAIDIFFDED